MAKRKYIIIHIMDNCIECIYRPYTNYVQAIQAYRKLIAHLFTDFSKKQIKDAVDNENAIDDEQTLSLITMVD